eukprot:9802622-Alexandrium_andersonii.AAC.1
MERMAPALDALKRMRNGEALSQEMSGISTMPGQFIDWEVSAPTVRKRTGGHIHRPETFARELLTFCPKKRSAGSGSRWSVPVLSLPDDPW